MHAASRYGTPGFTSLSKDAGLAVLVVLSGKSPIEFLTVHSFSLAAHSVRDTFVTSFISLIKQVSLS